MMAALHARPIAKARASALAGGCRIYWLPPVPPTPQHKTLRRWVGGGWVGGGVGGVGREAAGGHFIFR